MPVGIVSRATGRAGLTMVALSMLSLSGCSESAATETAVQQFEVETSGQEKASWTRWTAWGEPYPNMPPIVPPNVRARSYAPVPDNAKGPAVDPAKGYRLENYGDGVFMVSDGVYQSLIVVSDRGVILADAPPQLGAKLLTAAQEVAPSAKVVALIYSHAHLDHIGYAGEVLKANPSMEIIAHEETRRILARARDSQRPLPTQTFNSEGTDYNVSIGSQKLALQYPGPNHEPGNIGIYHPKSQVLMLIDVVFPGWIPFRRLAVSQDIVGYYDLVKSINQRWDYKVLVSGHLTRVGTPDDVNVQREFLFDLYNAAATGLGTASFGGNTVPRNSRDNPWVLFRDYLDQVNNECVNALRNKWSKRLGGFDVWIYEQCSVVEQSIRIDGLKP
jgi:glyoxylase-like metal-dependent hydrolase (beta-lactamase superfamily II)